MHDLQLDDMEDTDNTTPDPDDDHGEDEDHVDEDTSTALLAFLSKQQGSTHLGHLANVLSTSSKTKNAKGPKFMSKPDAGPPKDDEIVVNGKRYHQVQVHCIFYSFSSHKS